MGEPKLRQLLASSLLYLFIAVGEFPKNFLIIISTNEHLMGTWLYTHGCRGAIYDTNSGHYFGKKGTTPKRKMNK